ncbi:MAG: beta-propeller fold lactonase family protein [Gemmataceae bacterium]
MTKTLIRIGCVLVPAVLAVVWMAVPHQSQSASTKSTPPKVEVDRSPVDVILTADEKYLFTANQTSHTISVVDVKSGKVLQEVPCGKKPSEVELTRDEKMVLVSGTWSGDVTFFSFDNGKLSRLSELFLGFEPRGIETSPDGSVAYVALTTEHKVAVIDLKTRKLVEKIKTGQWPRYLAASNDGKYLAVGTSGDKGVTIVDARKRKMLWMDPFTGMNIGQMQVSSDNRYAYFPWMTYLGNPISGGNIQRGWVLGSRIGRIRLDKEYHRREAISLDPRGRAVADPHGFAISPNEQWIVCAASGTHELLVYKLPGLPWDDYGGPGDHIDRRLLYDRSRFYRIELGGRPMAARYSRDGKHVYVANYLHNAVQIVDVPGKKVIRKIELGGPKEMSIVRRGEAIFYDGKRSLDQWYSCHSCHYEGHTNSITMDTWNDGASGNPKTVLSLRNVTKTKPWTWHGWQKSLDDAMHKSITSTMQGKGPNNDDVKAMVAFLGTLTTPPNPYRNRDGSLTEAAQRGKKVFESRKANCTSCHRGEYFTSKGTYNVGTNSRYDRYDGYNPPSLLGVFDRVQYLHDGRSATLEDVVNRSHAPHKVTKNGKLTKQEASDLVEYLRSL